MLYQHGFRAQFFSALTNPSTRVVNNLTYSVIGVIGSLLAIGGQLTIGDISSFLIYANLFGKPFNEITSVFTQIQTALAGAGRIFSLLDMADEPENGSLLLSQPKGKVEFCNVSFSYREDRPLIQHFNLIVQPGQKVAIVGRTGAGKTTLVNLLMRFYDVNQGKILLDGIDLRDYNRDSLRSLFLAGCCRILGYILQPFETILHMEVRKPAKKKLLRLQNRPMRIGLSVGCQRVTIRFLLKLEKISLKVRNSC